MSNRKIDADNCVKGVGIRAGGSSFPNLILLYFRMDQPGPSTRNIAPQMNESPESPSSPDNRIDNIPRVGVEILLRIELESSSEGDYEEPSSEEINNVHDNNGPVNNNPPIDYGYDDDFIGDNNYTLYTRRDVYALRAIGPLCCSGEIVPGSLYPSLLSRKG